ncbi:hypothetical protein QFZ31_005754 [Neobacillus niacini]|uniref:hypothetical protein n=1 Tax=Neobacillus driksii TaxID=3035913 RepID=UPI00278317D3|nr:hypothetical protein [Neobacillus niacini]MDQ0975876.1 hypothetical protein [Neobacillus niacini]
MANLNDKFSLDDMRDLDQRLNHIFEQVTHYQTRSNAGLTELQLLNTIDHLCRVSGMLCDVIEQQIEGHYIESSDPLSYIDKNLGTVETGVKNFLKVKKIDIE